MALTETVDPGWTAAQSALVLAAIIAFVGGTVSATVTYALNQRAARRDRRAKTFADALAAVEDYAEMPYRIRRRRNHPDAMYELTDEVSRIQSRLAYSQALLQVEAPTVAAPYNLLVRAAKIQAGGQMQEAWRQPVLTSDAEMNLGVRYPRDEIDAARAPCVTAMRTDLKIRAREAVPLPTANSDRDPGRPDADAPNDQSRE
jgi:hypothetical protein